MHLTEFTFSNFLTHKIWCEAKRLLDFQIEQKSNNKHFNKLNFYYFESAKSCYEHIENETYFTERIATNLFYALENEFYTIPYTIPKKNLGIRNCHFFSYPMMILYYSVCLYLVKITENIIESRKSTNLISFYGASLRFKDDKLILNSNTTYHKSHYDDFQMHLNHFAKIEKNRYIIRIDIQNYYDSICINKFLNELSKRVSFTRSEELNFDTHTKDQLDFFFKFIKHNNGGIPQSDINVGSSFLGNLYLLFGDDIIEKSIKNTIPNTLISAFKVIRYVDDIFIVLDFLPEIPARKIESLVFYLLSSIYHSLHEDLKLNINLKTKIFKPHDEVLLLDFMREIGDISNKSDYDHDQIDLNAEAIKKNFEGNIFKTNNFTTIEKTERLLNFLGNLKNKHLNYEPIDSYGSISYDDLRNIYDRRVQNLLRKRENQQKLLFLLNGFNFELCRLEPQALMCIMVMNVKSGQDLLDYLLSIEPKTVYDINLLITYLCQVNFKDKRIKRVLKKNETMRLIFKKISQCTKQNKLCTGYYQLPYDKMSWIREQTNLIEQIKHRIHNERSKNYSISLNLLLNELQLICYIKEKPSIRLKDYDATSVANYLEVRGVRDEVKLTVSNLFNRRNNNGISHPGNIGHTPTAINKKEYLKYQKGVHEVLHHLLSDN